MKLNVISGDIENSSADTVIVNLFEGVTVPAGATGALNTALNGAISDLISSGDLTGKMGEVGVIYPRGAIAARRVLVVGLGQRNEFNLEMVRRAAGYAISKARDLNAKQVATIVHGAGVARLPVRAAAQATAEGSLMALYRYQAAKKAEDTKAIESLTIIEKDDSKIADIEAGSQRAVAINGGVTLARDLVNMPPNVATPTRLAHVATQIAQNYGLRLTIGDREWAAEHKMGGFLAVAKGAGEEPKFIVLEYNSDRPELETVVLVGKGITFDTGGISIKPSEKMEEMKTDMGGAAAVLGTMQVAAALQMPVHLVGITPCTENMPDANAYRPADVITLSNGKTVEIISTDAEGRMVLADGLVYAKRYNPQTVIDLATLTGACVIALGQNMAAGLFTIEDSLNQRLMAAGNVTYERVWPLPLWNDYRNAIKSLSADMKNSGGRYGGVGTSAIFLKEFTNYPWAHLDIAGMVYNEKGTAYSPAGATGYGVRLLIEFLTNW